MRIVFGFIKKKILYSDIVAFSTTNNSLASLDTSFDRIKIKCKRKASTKISVIDKKWFFNEVKNIILILLLYKLFK